MLVSKSVKVRINDQNKIILQELTDKYEKEPTFNEDNKNVESNSTKEDSSSTPQSPQPQSTTTDNQDKA